MAMQPSAGRPEERAPRPPAEPDQGSSSDPSGAAIPMILCYDRLRGSPQAFKSMTGTTVAEFDVLAAEVMGRLEEAEQARLDRDGRKRAPGGGHPYGLSPRDRILLTIVWLHQRPIHDVLGFLFGVSKTTVARTIARIRPLLSVLPGEDWRSSPLPGGGFETRGRGGLNLRGPDWTSGSLDLEPVEDGSTSLQNRF